MQQQKLTSEMRSFPTGATRDCETDKLDYEGFIDPQVLRRYAEYMHKHRLQTDGTMRESDNWKKGIPSEVYRKSLIRHAIQFWSKARGQGFKDDRGIEIDYGDALCAIIFNAMGLLYEEYVNNNATK